MDPRLQTTSHLFSARVQLIPGASNRDQAFKDKKRPKHATARHINRNGLSKLPHNTILQLDQAKAKAACSIQVFQKMESILARESCSDN